MPGCHWSFLTFVIRRSWPRRSRHPPGCRRATNIIFLSSCLCAMKSMKSIRHSCMIWCASWERARWPMSGISYGVAASSTSPMTSPGRPCTRTRSPTAKGRSLRASFLTRSFANGSWHSGHQRWTGPHISGATVSAAPHSGHGGSGALFLDVLLRRLIFHGDRIVFLASPRQWELPTEESESFRCHLALEWRTEDGRQIWIPVLGSDSCEHCQFGWRRRAHTALPSTDGHVIGCPSLTIRADGLSQLLLRPLQSLP